MVEPVPVGLFDLQLPLGTVRQFPPTTLLLVLNRSIHSMHRYSVQLYHVFTYRPSIIVSDTRTIRPTNIISCQLLLASKLQWMDSILKMRSIAKNKKKE